MKKHFILICVLALITPTLCISQSSFSYTVEEDNPDSGNKLYIGLSSLLKPPISGKHGNNFPIGPEVDAYNIFNRFALKTRLLFGTGLKLGKLDDRPEYHTKYFSGDIVLSANLISTYKTRKGKVTLRTDGDLQYVSHVEHKRKNSIGLRLGFGTINAPLRDYYQLNNVYFNDTLSVWIHGFNQQNVSLGLSVSTLSNLTLNTDIFGIVKKNSVSIFYADILFPLSTKGKHLVFANNSSGNDSSILLIDMETPDKFLLSEPSFRFGYERTLRLSSQIPIAGKVGVEIVKYQHFRRLNDVSIHFKIALLGVIG